MNACWGRGGNRDLVSVKNELIEVWSSICGEIFQTILSEAKYGYVKFGVDAEYYAH